MQARPHRKRHKYTNLTILALTTVITILLFRNETIHTSLLSLGNMSYFGAFLAGALFVSTFTISLGAVLLLVLAENLPLFELAIIAGLGSLAMDMLMFKFVRNNLINEIVPIYEELGGSHLTKLLHTKYFSWTLPVIGALIIASPFPDEIGVTLLGLSKMPTWKFALVAFFLDVLGIILVVSASTIIKP